MACLNCVVDFAVKCIGRSIKSLLRFDTEATLLGQRVNAGA